MKKNKHHIGQSMIEFALIFPILIFLLLGFLDIGRAIFYYSSLTNAVREATRFAIVNRNAIEDACNNPADNILQDVVLDFAFGLTNTPNPLTKQDINIPCPLNNPNQSITIEATYAFIPITPGIAQLIGNGTGIDLVAQSTMRIAGGSR